MKLKIFEKGETRVYIEFTATEAVQVLLKSKQAFDREKKTLRKTTNH